MVLLGDEAHVKTQFSSFGDSANLDANRCTVWNKRTRGSEIACTHRMELLGDVACGISFCPFEDSVSVGAR
jgi:hypothetical protein